MSLEFEKRIHYFSLDNDRGKFYTKNDKGITYVQAISGQFTRIYIKEIPYENIFVKKLIIELTDIQPTYSEIYVISLGFQTYFAQNTLNSLASIPEQIEDVHLKISVYKKGNYTRNLILCNTQKLPWKYSPDEIPKENREDFFSTIFQKISERFNGQSDSQGIEEDDLPF